MRHSIFTVLTIVGAMLLAGCASTNYVGVQITSNNPINMTHMWINGNTVVLCQVGDEKKARQINGLHNAQKKSRTWILQ